MGNLSIYVPVFSIFFHFELEACLEPSRFVEIFFRKVRAELRRMQPSFVAMKEKAGARACHHGEREVGVKLR